MVSNAKLAHYSRPVKSEKYFVLGKWQIFNRSYIVKKYRHRGLSIPKAWVATLGLIFLNLAIGLTKQDKNAINKGLGNICGAYKQIMGKEEQLIEHLK